MSVPDNDSGIPQTKEEKMELHRRPYQKPRLENLGDLRTLTLGGSKGLGDSGHELSQEIGPGGILPPGVEENPFRVP